MSGAPFDAARRLVADTLGKSVDEVPPDGDLGNVPGWDSLAHMRIMLSLEAALERKLLPDEIVGLRSVRDLAQALVRDVG